MKEELSIEKKAEAYDKAIEKFNAILNLDTVKERGTIFTDDVRKILSELAESEDEMIRKAIICGMYALKDQKKTCFASIPIDDVIAWLEKQDEDKKENLNILQRFSFYSYKDEPDILYLAGVFVNKEFRNKGIGTKILEVTDEVAKSLNYHTIRLKTKKDSNAERLYRTHGYNSLTTEDNDEIWLEKQSNKNEIDYDEELKKCKANPLYFFDKYVKVKLKEQKPADEEMIETLRAEYEKGRADVIAEMQKPAWSKEDETKLTIAQLFIRNTSLIGNDEIKKATIYWLNDLKNRVRPQSKQEWKQENTGDLNDFENAMMHIGNSFFGQYAGLDPNDTPTIKEQANLLLELVPNKEWSKEDENNILFLTSIIEECFKDKENITLYGDTICANFTKEDVINRLKSLRPKNTWKPSDEQMGALANACDGKILNLDYLNSLYQDLKKLKKGE